jgi:hypothetical protein
MRSDVPYGMYTHVRAQRLQLVLAPFHEARAGRRRGAEQREQQEGMAAEVADQREVLARR